MNLQNELGKRRSLMVVKIVDFGVYLGTKDEEGSASEERSACWY